MHILLFLLLFLAAIVIFGLSIVGFVLRAIFGLAVVRLPGRSRQGVDKMASSKVVPAITRTRTAVPITKGKSLLKTVQEPNIRKYSLRMTVNMWISRK